MLIRKIIVAAAATALAGAPVAAHAASAASPATAVQADRAGANVEGEELRGSTSGFAIPLVALVAVLGIILAIVLSGDDGPRSP